MFFLFLFLLLDATLWTFWLQEIWRKITFSEFRKLLQASLFMSKDDVWDITLNQTMIFPVLYLIFFLVDNKVLLSAHQKCNKGCNEAGSESIFFAVSHFPQAQGHTYVFPFIENFVFRAYIFMQGISWWHYNINFWPWNLGDRCWMLKSQITLFLEIRLG